MSKDKQPNWRRRFWLCALVLIVAYAFGEPWLEKWLGVDLPSIREGGDVATVESGRESHSDSGPDKFPSAERQHSAEAIDHSAGRATAESKPFLTSTGKKDRLQSPAGLIYAMGPGGEHRVDHVMRHARDDLTREDTHSVFDGSKQEILQRLDEAYLLIKSDSDRVKSERDARLDFRVEHEVDMRRRIGFLGGQRGRRENHPPRRKIKLILDNDRFVITAYPTN